MHAVDRTLGLTQEKLKQLLSYDPRTGVFLWRVWRPNGVKVGDVAGFVSASGYLKIKVEGHPYYAARLAWFYMTGRWPKEMIDHVDQDKLNNQWSNLREAWRSQNIAHKRGWAKSGFKGVRHRAKCPNRPWVAFIKANGRVRELGSFVTPEEANAAYLSAAKLAFGEFADGRNKVGG